jgi:hypothetical protein
MKSQCTIGWLWKDKLMNGLAYNIEANEFESISLNGMIKRKASI